MRERVAAARERARDEPLRRSQAANELLSRAVERLPLSARGRGRVARVARTIALLASADEVGSEHVAEALSYRSPTELASTVSDLVLSAFAAETGRHLVDEPREHRFERFRRGFDEAAFRSSLTGRGLRFIGRSERRVPAAAP